MSRSCTARLQKELKKITQNPLPHIQATPSPSDILEWHYVLEGDKDSPYGGGYYHGKIVFPPSYPYKPPSILMLTPSGRFIPGKKICLSITDMHPESWNVLWGVSSILLAIQSFFYENSITTGSLRNVSDKEKRDLAIKSLSYNVKNPLFRKLFPDLVELEKSQAKQMIKEKNVEKESVLPSDEIRRGGYAFITESFILAVAVTVLAFTLYLIYQ